MPLHQRAMAARKDAPLTSMSLLRVPLSPDRSPTRLSGLISKAKTPSAPPPGGFTLAIAGRASQPAIKKSPGARGFKYSRIGRATTVGVDARRRRRNGYATPVSFSRALPGRSRCPMRAVICRLDVSGAVWPPTHRLSCLARNAILLSSCHATHAPLPAALVDRGTYGVGQVLSQEEIE